MSSTRARNSDITVSGMHFFAAKALPGITLMSRYVELCSSYRIWHYGLFDFNS